MNNGDDTGALSFSASNLLVFVGESGDTLDDADLDGTYHLSCSEDVGIGAVRGDTMVIAGTSQNGGPLPFTGSRCWCTEGSEPEEGCCP